MSQNVDNLLTMMVYAYTPYLRSLGGGEKYFLNILKEISKYCQVTLICAPRDTAALPVLSNIFNIDLTFLSVKTCELTTESDLNNAVPNDSAFLQIGNEIPIMVNCKARIFHHQTIYSTNEHSSKYSHISSQEVQHRFNSQHLVFFPSKFIFDYMTSAWFLETSKCDIINPPVSSEFTEHVNLPHKRSGIISVGRFHPIKKQKYQIDLFKSLDVRLQKDNNLVLIGPTKTPLSIELEKLATGYPIDFKYSLNQAELRNEYSKAKVIWSTTGLETGETTNSHNVESFGLSLIEAMCCGCVPVAISAGGVTEVINDSGNKKDGVLVKNLDELGAATKLLLSTNNELQTLSINASDKASGFSITAFERSVLNKIVNVINIAMQ